MTPNPMSWNYEQLESDLRQLLSDWQHDLPSGEWSDIENYIDHGEYGLAFESMCDELKKQNYVVTPLQYQLLDGIRLQMGLPESLLSMDVSS
jgi:hypothetical protein